MRCPSCNHLYGAMEGWEKSWAMSRFQPLRDHPSFEAVWLQWIEWTQRDMSQAKEPDDLQARMMFEMALESPKAYMDAISRAMIGNWKTPRLDLAPEGKAVKESAVQNAKPPEDAYMAWNMIYSFLTRGANPDATCSLQSRKALEIVQDEAEEEDKVFGGLHYREQRERFVRAFERT